MDGALKLAHRATGRTKFVSTTQSFHGRTLGALSIIGQEKHRAPYQRILQEGCFVPFGDLDAARRAIDDEHRRVRRRAGAGRRRRQRRAAPATSPGCAS